MKNKSLFGMIDVHLLGKQVDWFWIQMMLKDEKDQVVLVISFALFLSCMSGVVVKKKTIESFKYRI